MQKKGLEFGGSLNRLVNLVVNRAKKQAVLTNSSENKMYVFMYVGRSRRNKQINKLKKFIFTSALLKPASSTAVLFARVRVRPTFKTRL